VRLDLYQSHSTYTTAVGNTTVSTGVWHHVAAVFDGSQTRIYLDGVLDGSISSSSAPASGNSLTKTAGAAWGNAGASSTQTITSGDGYVEFTASKTSTYRMIGLSQGDADQNYTDIDFAMYPTGTGGSGSHIYVYESGVYKGDFGVYATGDVLRVAVEGGVVKYKKNGALLYTSTVTPSYPLLVDTALHTNGATLANVVISSGGGGGGSNPSATVRWLVADHLGTPRMIFDQGGSLANVSRHDYLPFGEEVPSNFRTGTPGYTASDGVRQKFTSKERDNETGLDYFLARYYSSAQGRFISPDEFNGGPVELFVRTGDSKRQGLPYAEIAQPQSLNKYTYVYNNPCRFVDPDGHCGTPSGLQPGQVGICVASYIRSTFFPRLAPPGRGDNRGPNGQGGTSRVEVRMVVDPKAGTVTKTDEAMGTSGILHKEAGLKGKGASRISTPAKDEKGNLYFQVNQHGESFTNVAGVLGSIDNHLNMVVTTDSKVGVTPSSTARDFPSLEVFKYTMDEKGKVTTTLVLDKRESGNFLDLRKSEKRIEADPK
jgi:RHS repeat-associated protein